MRWKLSSYNFSLQAKVRKPQITRNKLSMQWPLGHKAGMLMLLPSAQTSWKVSSRAIVTRITLLKGQGLASRLKSRNQWENCKMRRRWRHPWTTGPIIISMVTVFLKRSFRLSKKNPFNSASQDNRLGDHLCDKVSELRHLRKCLIIKRLDFNKITVKIRCQIITPPRISLKRESRKRKSMPRLSYRKRKSWAWAWLQAIRTRRKVLLTFPSPYRTWLGRSEDDPPSPK